MGTSTTSNRKNLLMKTLCITLVVVVVSLYTLVQEVRADYTKYKVESSCARQQVAHGVERRDVDFTKCREITWTIK